MSRTRSVRLPDDLDDRITQRLGETLEFSPLVVDLLHGWLDADPGQTPIEALLKRARQYNTAKAHSVEFRRDVRQILAAEGAVSESALIECGGSSPSCPGTGECTCRPDFTIRDAGDGGRCIAYVDAVGRVSNDRMFLALGQCLLYKQATGAPVGVCVPYPPADEASWARTRATYEAAGVALLLPGDLRAWIRGIRKGS